MLHYSHKMDIRYAWFFATTPPSSQPQLQENRGVVNPKTGENVQPAGTGVQPLTGDYYLPREAAIQSQDRVIRAQETVDIC